MIALFPHTKCPIHTKCEAGKYVNLNVTASRDRFCADCTSGKFSSVALIADTYPWYGADAIKNGGVGACSNCPAGCEFFLLHLFLSCSKPRLHKDTEDTVFSALLFVSNVFFRFSKSK